MITQEEAIAIAEKLHSTEFKLYGVTRGVPSNFAIYGSFPRNPDDVWCVYYSLRSGKVGLIASGHAVVIANDTGQVLYDGSACDEG